MYPYDQTGDGLDAGGILGGLAGLARGVVDVVNVVNRDSGAELSGKVF